MRFAPGSRFGAYEILSPLGAGGMGEVYRARDSKLGRDVAIKVLPAAFLSDPDRMARFEREARLLASLNHPAIGAIYGLEHAPLGPGQTLIPALVLELIEGETLADRLRRGPLPLEAALGIARQIADALEVAHERGIVHRDVKPANIKVTTDDGVKVLDFGLAKALEAGLGADSESETANSPTITSAATRDGLVLGTAAYMSPEQARGKPVDKRSDVWAFGCVLYEMLTGSRAFNGETFSDTIASVLEREPDLSSLPASTPNGLRVLLRRCLQKDVKRRLRDIADARIELDDAAGVSAAGIVNDGTPTRIGPPRLSPLVAAMMAVALVVTAAAGWLAGRRQQPAAAPAFDRIVRLVSTAAHEFGPVISPDGKWVAYLSNAQGRSDVWVKFVDTGDPINLTISTGVTVQSLDGIGGLAVSPDGSQLAFQGQAQSPQLGGTWVIPAPLGGAPRRVLETGNAGLQWSPDGKRIAYVKSGGALGDALVIADADGQHDAEIVKRQGARHIHWVRWDPEGKFVYFNHGLQNANSEPTEIFRAPASGGPSERVVSTARRAVSPFPHRDGLFFAANPDGVDLGLWWKHLSSGRQYPITTGLGEYNAPTVSADGNRVTGTIVDVRRSIERVAVTLERPVSLEPLTDGLSGEIDPVWSRDGTQMAFSSSRSGSRTIWASPRGDLTQREPITTGPYLDDRPAFSPDGRQIAFVSDRSGHRGIWLVSADGGTARLIASADVIDVLSWAPDGRRLVYATPIGDAPGLMVIDVASGQTTRVPTPAAATAPSWSPRDDVIAYIEPRGGAIGAFVKFVTSKGDPVYGDIDAPASQGFGNGFLFWSHDGRRLAAVALPGGFSGSIWIIEPEGRTPFRKLLDLPAGALLRGGTWSPDGTSLIVGRVQSNGDIFLAERSKRQ